MKKYRVKNKVNGYLFGEFSSPKEASIKLMEYLKVCDNFSPFDYKLEEAECKEVNEVITDFESARKALGVKPNDDYLLVSGEHPGREYDDVERLVRELNPKHIEALVALNRLFTIAEAWNNADGFVPDFSDWKQKKWYPWFKYDKDAAGFVCATANYTPAYASAYLGSRLCFMTAKRAEQFGKQFIELYNKVFLITNK